MREETERTDGTELKVDSRSKRHRAYEAPKFTTYTQEEILAKIGPARALYGPPGGAP